MTGCAAPMCSGNSRHGLRLFRFPTSPNRRAIWIQNCRRDKSTLKASSRLCERHFENNQYESIDVLPRKLRHTPIPTIFNFSKAPNVHKVKRSTRSKKPCLDVEIPAVEFHECARAIKIEIEDPEYDVLSQITPIQGDDEFELPVEPTVASAALPDRYYKIEIEDNEIDVKPPIALIQDGDHESEAPVEPTDAVAVIPDRYYKIEIEENEIDVKPQINVTESSETRSALSFSESFDESTSTNVYTTEHTIIIQELDTSEAIHPDAEKPDRPVHQASSSFNKSSSSYSCFSCGTKFKNKSWLIKHFMTEYLDQPCRYTCGYCPRIFQRYSYMRSHVVTKHTEKRLFHCSMCTKWFHTSPELHRHFENHPSHVKKLYACTVCDRSYDNISCLKDHKLNHISKKSYGCANCDLTFKRKSHLLRHTKTHMDESFSCEICGKCFTLSSYRTAHMISHSVNKEYKCLECGKTYKRSGALGQHMKNHVVKRPFSCQTCGKSFYVKSILDRHQKTHLHAKEFSCSLCLKTYKQEGSFKTHQIWHSRGLPFPCTLCSQSFQGKYQLQRHLKRHAR